MAGGRPRRPVAYLCIAAVLLAAVMPGLSAADLAIPEPGWILLPDAGALTPVATLPVASPEPQATLTPCAGRAPPRPSPVRSHA